MLRGCNIGIYIMVVKRIVKRLLFVSSVHDSGQVVRMCTQVADRYNLCQELCFGRSLLGLS